MMMMMISYSKNHSFPRTTLFPNPILPILPVSRNPFSQTSPVNRSPRRSTNQCRTSQHSAGIRHPAPVRSFPLAVLTLNAPVRRRPPTQPRNPQRAAPPTQTPADVSAVGGGGGRAGAAAGRGRQWVRRELPQALAAVWRGVSR